MAKVLSGEINTSGAEVLWQWASIDPQVIRAVDAAHVDTVTSGFDLAQWVHQRIDPLEGDSLAGMQNRLLGYLGEQRVSGLLAAQGHQVEMATTANQPIWDLLMDGQQVNVKTVLELDGINPQVAARLSRALDGWRKLAEPYRSAAKEAISRVAAKADLSADVREVITRALAGEA